MPTFTYTDDFTRFRHDGADNGCACSNCGAHVPPITPHPDWRYSMGVWYHRCGQMPSPWRPAPRYRDIPF